MTLLCHCGLEANVIEHHDNYLRPYACCPKREDIACAYFQEVDPPYPQKAMDVIDNLVAESRELRDTLIEERNSHYWMQEEDSAVDRTIRGHITHLKFKLNVAYVVIVCLVAVVVSMVFHKST